MYELLAFILYCVPLYIYTYIYYIYVYICIYIYVYIYYVIYVYIKHSSQSNLKTQYVFFLCLDLSHLPTVYTAHYPYYFLGTMVTLMN